jgi:hypothetical protein
LLIGLVGLQVANADWRDCVQVAVDGLKEAIGHLEGFVEWAKDAKETWEKIEAKQATCDAIPRSDPPTFLQKLKIDACELGVNTAKTYETARLVSKLTKLGDEAKVAADEFGYSVKTCFNNNPEEPEYMYQGMIF